MKQILLFAILLLSFQLPVFSHSEISELGILGFNSFTIKELGHVKIRFNKDQIIIENMETRNTARIDDKKELYYNDDFVPLDSEQQRLVEVYYETSMEIAKLTRDIGREGVKIGLEGLQLGVVSVVEVIKLAAEGFDDQAQRKFEKKMEWESEKIENHGEYLGEQADHLEEMVEQLKERHIQMTEEIPRLREF